MSTSPLRGHLAECPHGVRLTRKECLVCLKGYLSTFPGWSIERRLLKVIQQLQRQSKAAHASKLALIRELRDKEGKSWDEIAYLMGRKSNSLQEVYHDALST
jgi:hypothetical protein